MVSTTGVAGHVVMSKNEHGTAHMQLLMSSDTHTPVGHGSVEGDHVHSSSCTRSL